MANRVNPNAVPKVGEEFVVFPGFGDPNASIAVVCTGVKETGTVDAEGEPIHMITFKARRGQREALDAAWRGQRYITTVDRFGLRGDSAASQSGAPHAGASPDERGAETGGGGAEGEGGGEGGGEGEGKNTGAEGEETAAADAAAAAAAAAADDDSEKEGSTEADATANGSDKTSSSTAAAAAIPPHHNHEYPVETQARVGLAFAIQFSSITIPFPTTLAAMAITPSSYLYSGRQVLPAPRVGSGHGHEAELGRRLVHHHLHGWRLG